MIQLQKDEYEKMYKQLLNVQQQHDKITFQRMIKLQKDEDEKMYKLFLKVQTEKEKYESNLKLKKDENELLRNQLKKQMFEEKIEIILVNNATNCNCDKSTKKQQDLIFITSGSSSKNV